VRPYVHINFAIDQRGRHCSADGMPLSISCEKDWQRVHSLREQYDGVAVGGRTWNVDRPSLSARADRLGRDASRQPVRVVFAGNHLCETTRPGTRTYLIGECRAQSAGTPVIPSPGHELKYPLEELVRFGIRSLLVEGGPTLLKSFLVQGSFDRITVFVRGATTQEALAHAAAVLPGLPATMVVEAFGQGLLLAYTRGDEAQCAPLLQQSAGQG
jgi:riboflavin biosynthesis pyrimidine reductase